MAKKLTAFQMRVDADWLAKLDDYCSTFRPPLRRAAAVRSLVEKGVQPKAKKGKSA